MLAEKAKPTDAAAPARPDEKPLSWPQLAEFDPDALVSQSGPWIEALRRCGYDDATRLYSMRSGARMALPMVRRLRSLPPHLAPLASMPDGWGMGGLVAEEPPSVADVTRVAADLASLPSLQVTVRPNPVHAGLWAQATQGTGAIALPRRAHVLDLQGGSDAVWEDRFTSSARRAVRKAEAAGLEVRGGNDHELLCDFRRLYESSLVRWAAAQNEPVSLARLRAYRRDPPAKFMHVADSLSSGLRTWIAYLDGLPIAGLMVLLGTNASYTRGAMDRDLVGSHRPNELLHWHAIRDACDAGARKYHLGETGASPTLARFKEKLGGEPVDYAEYRFKRFPVTGAIAPMRSMVKRAIGFRDV